MRIIDFREAIIIHAKHLGTYLLTQLAAGTYALVNIRYPWHVRYPLFAMAAYSFFDGAIKVELIYLSTARAIHHRIRRCSHYEIITNITHKPKTGASNLSNLHFNF